MNFNEETQEIYDELKRKIETLRKIQERDGLNRIQYGRLKAFESLKWEIMREYS